MAIATAAEAILSARTYLNDVGSVMWSDSALLPYIKEAHRDLQLALLLNGIPVVKEKSTAITVTAVSEVSLAPLPSDFIEPIDLKERASGSSEDWIPMEERDWEDEIDQTATLRYWNFREEEIKLIGATTAREVLLRYWKGLTAISATSTTLGFTLAEVFVGPQAAAYAAGSLGNTTLAQELLYAPGVNIGVAGAKLNQIIQFNVKNMQNLPARRIPYRRSRRGYW